MRKQHTITATVTVTPAASSWTATTEATGEEIAKRIHSFLVARFGESTPVWTGNGELWTVPLSEIAFTVTTEEVPVIEADNTATIDKVEVAAEPVADRLMTGGQ